MQDRPEARELVEAVAAFLEQEVAPGLGDARLRFRALIAANVLGVVGRELAAGEAPLRAEWTRLRALLDPPDPAGSPDPPCDAAALREAVNALNRALCARIRAGDADRGP